MPGRDQSDPVVNTLRRVEVVIRGNGTFERVEGGIPSSGVVSFSGDAASLHVQRILDRPVEDVGPGAVRQNQPIQLKWLGENQIEYTDSASFYPDPIKLSRVVATDP
ncbi:MAG: hypothetical protein KF812_07475 [Fimbriimonadaceae bacterium]|nr:hypothetical protein [Fimbriimonadaceae bacterium]